MNNNSFLQNVGVVILAAGKGTRLGCTDKPKVMLEIGGRPIIDYPVTTLEQMNFLPRQICLVVGFYKEKVQEFLGSRVSYAFQEELLGTAHAAFTGMKTLPKEIKHVLVMGGDDSAFYTPETLLSLIQKHIESNVVLSLLSAEEENVEQLGRVVRREDYVEIIEKEYLTEEQKKIKEISTGTFVFNREWFLQMFPTMPKLRKLGEFGLPTTLPMAKAAGLPYQVVKLSNNQEWFGVNTVEELAEADKRKSN